MDTRIFLKLALLCLVPLLLLPAPVLAELKKNNPPASPADSKAGLSPEDRKAQTELETLKSKPKEYRVLILGVQIFLGRFGYGTGPYTGKMDTRTQEALRAYQEYVKLPVTGDIDLPTLQSLTRDNLALDQPIPYLPQANYEFTKWKTAIQAQGSWIRKDAATTDSVHTSKISCNRKENYCIESTAILLNESALILEVLTNIYSIKEWGEDTVITNPYTGEPCTTSILRINRKEQTILRFTAYQAGEGLCEKVETEDVQYRLMNGQKAYAQLKQQKAEHTQRILRVQH